MKLGPSGENIWIGKDEAARYTCVPHPNHGAAPVTIRESTMTRFDPSDVVGYMVRDVVARGRNKLRKMTQGVLRNGKCFATTLDLAVASGKPVMTKDQAEQMWYLESVRKSTDDLNVRAKQDALHAAYKHDVKYKPVVEEKRAERAEVVDMESSE